MSSVGFVGSGFCSGMLSAPPSLCFTPLWISDNICDIIHRKEKYTSKGYQVPVSKIGIDDKKVNKLLMFYDKYFYKTNLYPIKDNKL